MKKVRNHNEWFRTVSLGNRKSCPTCKKKLEAGESIWSWGEYLNAKWRTILHFCKNCYEEEVKQKLQSHAAECGCNITLVYKDPAPDWLKLDQDLCQKV